MERTRAWAKSEVKYKANIVRIATEARGRAKTEVTERVRVRDKGEAN